MKCQGCSRKASKSICDFCWERGLTQLLQLPKNYKELEDVLIPSAGYGQKVSGTRTPPLPARLDVLYLRTSGITEILYKHEALIRSEQKHSRITFRGDEPAKILQSVTYLTGHWAWVKGYYLDGDQLVIDVNKLSGQIQTVLGNKSEDITIGTCPAIDENEQLCGAKLKISPNVLERLGDIKCNTCATVWTSQKWRLLGKILESTSGHGDSVAAI
jgi:hypothetical protein